MSGCLPLHPVPCFCTPVPAPSLTTVALPAGETVTAESYQICLAKSPNKHNRLWAKAEPMHPDLQADIDSGRVVPVPRDPAAQAR